MINLFSVYYLLRIGTCKKFWCRGWPFWTGSYLDHHGIVMGHFEDERGDAALWGQLWCLHLFSPRCAFVRTWQLTWWSSRLIFRGHFPSVNLVLKIRPLTDGFNQSNVTYVPFFRSIKNSQMQHNNVFWNTNRNKKEKQRNPSVYVCRLRGCISKVKQLLTQECKCFEKAYQEGKKNHSPKIHD